MRVIKIPKTFLSDSLVWLSRTSLPEILFISTLVLSRYQSNIDFSYPKEIWLPLALFAVLASATYYTFRFIFGRVTAGHLASLPMMYVLFNFNQILGYNERWVNALLPGRFETSFSRTLLFWLVASLVAGAIGFGLTKLFDRHPFRGFQIPKIALFLVVFLFLAQSVQIGMRLIGLRDEISYRYQPQSLSQDKAKITSKPDIYYFVFDRYGNGTTLANEYGMDNGKLLDYLDQQGFVTRSDGYANYPFTMSSISSTLAMNYHTQLKQFGSDSFQSGFPYRSILNDPPVVQALRQNGYQYNQVSSWWDFTRVGINADTHPTQAFRFDLLGLHYGLSDLQRDMLDRSIAGNLLRKGVTVGSSKIIKYDLTLNPRQNFEWQMSTLKDIAATKHSAPQFTFAHVLVPHDPYIFTADGSQPTYDSGRNDNGVDEKVKYVNQLTYLNTRIQDLVGSIRATSPGAVIVIQADEGPYPKEFRFELSPDHFYNPKDLALPQMKQKFGVLASYYMPDADKTKVANDITASVNPFRFVLANYLGYDLPMLPDCQFATGDKYVVYSYDLVTEKLTSKPANPACSQL